MKISINKCFNLICQLMKRIILFVLLLTGSLFGNNKLLAQINCIPTNSVWAVTLLDGQINMPRFNIEVLCNTTWTVCWPLSERSRLNPTRAVSEWKDLAALLAAYCRQWQFSMQLPGIERVSAEWVMLKILKYAEQMPLQCRMGVVILGEFNSVNTGRP